MPPQWISSASAEEVMPNIWQAPNYRWLLGTGEADSFHPVLKRWTLYFKPSCRGGRTADYTIGFVRWGARWRPLSASIFGQCFDRPQEWPLEEV